MFGDELQVSNSNYKHVLKPKHFKLQMFVQDMLLNRFIMAPLLKSKPPRNSGP